MKARFNNGKITVYEQLPETFNNGEISIIGEMDKLTKEELEALGFYDLVKPPIDEATQRYANIIWDAEAKQYTYCVEQKPQVTNPILTKFQFISRLTMTERLAIYTAEATDPMIRMWLDTFRICDDIDLTNPDTETGVQMLEAAGFIAPGRVNEILNINAN